METNFYHPLERLIPMMSLSLPSGSLTPLDHSLKSAEFNISQYLKNVMPPHCRVPLFPTEMNVVSQLHNTNLKELSLHYPQLWHDFQQKCQLMFNTMKVKEMLNANLLPRVTTHKSDHSKVPPAIKSIPGSQFSIKCLIDDHSTTEDELSEVDKHKDLRNITDCGHSFCFSESSLALSTNELAAGVHKDSSSPLNSLNRFDCQNCQKSYSTRTGLQRHYENHCNNGPEPKQFSCEHCSKVYHSLSALKMHIRTHTLPCKCSVCGKAFSRMWLLNGHLRTHSGEKPFCCSICDRAFADRSNLRAHLQTHTDIKKYECSQCKKTFSRMGLLTKHKSSNNCKRPPPCKL